MRSSYCYLILPALAVFVSAPPAHGQSYTLSPVLLNDSVQVPGGSDLFHFNEEAGFSIDENLISLTQNAPSCDAYNGIWMINVSSGQITQLVALGSAAPQTQGEAFAFSTCLPPNQDEVFGDYSVLKGKRVALLGCAGTPGSCWGVYSVAAAAGQKPRVVANQFTVLPGVNQMGSMNFSSAPNGVVHADDQHMVFAPYSGFSPGGGNAAFVANIDGSALAELAGPNVPVEYPNSNCNTALDSFLQPRVTGSNIIFLGSSGFPGPSPVGLFLTGLTGIPVTTPTCTPNGYYAYPPLVTDQTVLTGVPNNVRLESNSSLLAINQKEIYFTAASSEPAPQPTAIFAESISAAAGGTGQPRPILRLTTQLPGFPAPPYVITAMSAQFDTLVFEATPVGTGDNGIFVYQNGAFTRVVGTGDAFDGDVIKNVYLNSNSLSNSRILFGFACDFISGIALATPGA